MILLFSVLGFGGRPWPWFFASFPVFPPIRLASFHTFQDARTSAQRQGCSLQAGSLASKQE